MAPDAFTHVHRRSFSELVSSGSVLHPNPNKAIYISPNPFCLAGFMSVCMSMVEEGIANANANMLNRQFKKVQVNTKCMVTFLLVFLVSACLTIPLISFI